LNRVLLSRTIEYEIEALARCLLPEIQKFFESKEGQREFAEWKKKQAINKQNSYI
jgi:hypothetical protein